MFTGKSLTELENLMNKAIEDGTYEDIPLSYNCDVIPGWAAFEENCDVIPVWDDFEESSNILNFSEPDPEAEILFELDFEAGKCKKCGE